MLSAPTRIHLKRKTRRQKNSSGEDLSRALEESQRKMQEMQITQDKLCVCVRKLAELANIPLGDLKTEESKEDAHSRKKRRSSGATSVAASSNRSSWESLIEVG